MVTAAPAMEPSGALRSERESTLEGPVVGFCFGAMLVLSTFENHTRWGRVAFSAIAIGIVAWAAFRGRLSLEPLKKIAAPLCAVYATTIFAIALSFDRAYSFNTFYHQHLSFFLLFAAVGLWAVSAARQKAFMRGLVIAGAVSGALGLFLFFFARDFAHMNWFHKSHKASDFIYKAQTSDGAVYYRAQGMLESYTRSAIVFVFALPACVALCVFAAREGRKRDFVLLALCGGVGFVYVIMTKSRGPWIATGIACCLTLLFLRVRWWIPVALCAIAAGALATSSSTRERAMTFFSARDNPKILLSDRQTLWREGLVPISENLLHGLGYGQDIFMRPPVVARYGRLTSADNKQPDLHQTILQTLAEVGIPGLVAYAWLIGVLLWLGARSVRSGWMEAPGSVTAFAILIALLLFGLVYSFNEKNIAQIMWATLGMIASVAARRGIADRKPVQSA
ncbi:hypothetical protein BH09SUM1_BH09SUM1_22990 [soil metagenome]